MANPQLAPIGTLVAIAAALIKLVVRILLPYTLDSALLSSVLLRAEDAAELAAVTAFVLCAFQVFSAFRAGARKRFVVALAGLLVAGAVLAPTVAAFVLALAMGAGGAIPR